MKILTLSIIASLTLGASAYAVPGTEYRGTTEVIYIDTADTFDEEMDFPTYTPIDHQTLIQINGLPDDYSNRDFDKELKRTYNMRETIESDYGKHTST